MRLPSHGLPPVLAVTVVLAGAIWITSGQRIPVRADPPPAVRPPVTVYDPNPKHLWNRLHDALLVRIDGVDAGDPDQLDPFLWQQSPYATNTEHTRRAAAVLDEMIAEHGSRLITDIRKRALLHRDLWTMFDTVAPSRWLIGPGQNDRELELAARLARILPSLALTAEEIQSLPDNFAEALKAGTFPDWVNADRLWDPKGPWVLVGSEGTMPLARTHVEFFGGRSAFFIFLRLPDGRESTEKYVAELRAGGPVPRVPPGGVYFALVRRMLLFDKRGKLTLTPITESVQIRGLGHHKLQLNRPNLIAGKPSLVALRTEDEDRNFIARLGQNTGDGRTRVLGTCGSCHLPDVMESHVRSFPRGQSIRPTVIPTRRDDEWQRQRIAKKERYEWGLLQGLMLAHPRE